MKITKRFVYTVVDIFELNCEHLSADNIFRINATIKLSPTESMWN